MGKKCRDVYVEGFVYSLEAEKGIAICFEYPTLIGERVSLHNLECNAFIDINLYGSLGN